MIAKSEKDGAAMKNNSTTYLCLILAPLFWSGNYMMGKLIVNIIPPIGLNFFRWTLVVVLLLPFVYKQLMQNKATIYKNLHWIVLLGFLSVVIYTSFVYIGLQYTTVVNAGLLSAIVPVVIMALSYFMLNEKLSLLKVVGVISSILGVMVIITHGHLADILQLKANMGDMLILIAVIAWGFFSTLLKKLSLQLSPLIILYCTAVAGAFILLPAYGYTMMHGHIVHFNLITLMSVSYAAIFASIFAFTFWNIGVMRIGPSKASYFLNLLPVFCCILAIVILHEQFHFYAVVGALLVLLGIVCATCFNKR